MTQQMRLYLMEMFLLFLLFEPVISSRNEQYNSRQDRSPFFDVKSYFSPNYGDSINQRNYEYRPYQPHYASPQLQQHQFQRRREEVALQPRTSQQFEYPDFNTQPQQRSVPEPVPRHPLSLPLPYQGNPKSLESEADVEDKIRSIFYLGPEDDLKIFNTSLDPKLSSFDRMHGDDSFKSNNNETSTDPLSNQSSSNIGMVLPSSLLSSSSSSSSSSSLVPLPVVSSPSSPTVMTSVINDEPIFKVQRAPDGKLSLVFNDILSLQRPTSTQPKEPPAVHKRPGIVFPTTPVSETAYNGCDAYDGSLFCKKVRGYPNIAQLDTILQREFSKSGLFFTEDVEQPFNVSQRFGGDPDEIDPCRSIERTIYPEAGQTSDSKWLLIVNDKNSYKQGVRVEECIGNNEPCENIDEFLPISYRSVCKQSYVYRSLVALTENGTVVKEQFKIPSCCKCVLRQVRRS